MRYNKTLRILALTLLIIACRKNHFPDPGTPLQPDPVKKVLLKDIVIPGLPSPYYHFEYNPDSTASKVGFDDDLATYTVVYAGKKIADMRNNATGPAFLNQDTLRYLYDQKGKLFMIQFIDKSNVNFRRVSFMYNGDLVKEIEWDQKVEGGFIIDRTLKLEYYPDGNVKTISEHLADLHGSTGGSNSTTLFEQYDDKTNVDDFSLIHSGINDHLFLLQGFRLQKNNPGKVTFTQDSNLNNYTANYTYIYNSDNTPSKKTGDLLFTGGTQAGQKFKSTTSYTYY